MKWLRTVVGCMRLAAAARSRSCGSARRRSRPAARGRGRGAPWAGLSGSGSRWPGDGGLKQGRAGALALQKSVDLLPALGRKDRAGDVEQPPAGRQQRPQGIEHLGLHAGQRVRCRRRGAASARRGGGARCPRRCTAHRAGWHRTAGRPTSGRGCRASPAFSVAASCRRVERVLHARQAQRVAVQRQQVEVGQLQQMRGLAAGGGAGIEHARAAAAAPAPSSSSGAARCAAASCTETSPSAKPGSCGTGQGCGQHHGLAAAAVEQLRRAAQCRQALHVAGTGAAAGVDAQRHRRMFVGRVQQRAATARGQSRLTRSIHHSGWL